MVMITRHDDRLYRGTASNDDMPLDSHDYTYVDCSAFTELGIVRHTEGFNVVNSQR